MQSFADFEIEYFVWQIRSSGHDDYREEGEDEHKGHAPLRFRVVCRVVCRVVVGPIIHDRVQCDEVCEIADPFEDSNFDTAVKSGVDYAITIGTPRGTPAVLDDIISARVIANDLDSMLQIR